MTIIALKKRMQTLEEQSNVKRELPWDCKNLMSFYKEERARESIIFKWKAIKGEACEPPEPVKLEVDDQRGLSREAREFLSLSAEKQGKAVNYFCPTRPISEEEAEEIRRNILDRIYRIGGLEELEHRLTKGR
jgi:hypothetical protein